VALRPVLQTGTFMDALQRFGTGYRHDTHLARELAPGILVNNMAPGSIETDMTSPAISPPWPCSLQGRRRVSSPVNASA
jgi:hypothetical protein